MLKVSKARLVLKEEGVAFFLKSEILKRWAVFLQLVSYSLYVIMIEFQLTEYSIAHTLILENVQVFKIRMKMYRTTLQ